MNRTLLIALALLVVANAAFAQAGAICLFADPQGTDCMLTDTGPGFMSIHVVHMLTAGATASQFWAPIPECMNGASWLGDTQVFPVTIGNSQTGVAIGYGHCLSAPIHILTINLDTTGMTETDCLYRVKPHSGYSLIEVSDCDEQLLFAGGGRTYINSDLACVCQEVDFPQLDVSPTELDFGDTVEDLSFQIINAGGETLDWTVTDNANWLTESPTAGTDEATISVSADRSTLPAGEHTANITVTSNGGDQTILVTISTQPVLDVTPAEFDFGGSLEHTNFFITNSGTGLLTWDIAHTVPWLSVTPLSGSGDEVLLASVDRTGLAPGDYSGEFTVNSNGGTAAVVVSMSVEPVLIISPTLLEFGSSETTKAFLISNGGNGVLTWDIATATPWIMVTPTTGIENDVISVVVDRTGLADGIHEGAITVSSNGGEGVVLVTAIVGPELHVFPTSMHLSGTTMTRTFLIRNLGSGELTWNVAPESPKVHAEPLVGTGDATITVTVDRCLIPPPTTEHTPIYVTSNAGDKVVWVSADYMRDIYVSEDYLPFYGDQPAPQTFQIQVACADTVDWYLAIDYPGQEFLSVTPVSGVGTQTVTVNIVPPQPLPQPPLDATIIVWSPSSLDPLLLFVWWSYGDTEVPTKTNTWGSLKGKYKGDKKE